MNMRAPWKTCWRGAAACCSWMPGWLARWRPRSGAILQEETGADPQVAAFEDLAKLT